jgi:glyoxylase-like metal-dependent hydrolase (beta-lactamase superfamily II)
MDGLYLVGSGAMGLSYAFDCHVYAVDCGNTLIMIDSGAGESPELILSNMEKDGLDPRRVSALLLTHSHLDHAGGAAFFRASLGCRVYVANEEKEILEKGTEESTGLMAAKRSGLYSPDYPVRHCIADVVLYGGERLLLGNLQYIVYLICSHSTGSMCYLVEIPGVGRALFTGDVVFSDGLISVLNIEGSSLTGYRRNLVALSGLAVDALMPGHGLFTTSGGQRHIDIAIESLGLLRPPRNIY